MQTVSASFAEIVIQGIGEWLVMSVLAALLGAFCSRLHDINGAHSAGKVHAIIACLGVVVMMAIKPVSDTQTGVLAVFVALCLLLVPAVLYAVPRITNLCEILRARGGDSFSAGAALFAGVACGSGETSAIVITMLVIAFASLWHDASREERREAVASSQSIVVRPVMAIPADVAVQPEPAVQARRVVSAPALNEFPAFNVVRLDIPTTFVRKTTALVLQDNQDNKVPEQLTFNFAA